MIFQIKPDALRIPLRFPADLFSFNADTLFALCQANELFFIEQEANGDVLVKPLQRGLASSKNAALSTELVYWNRSENYGIAFGFMVGFVLPNNALRSPSAAWVRFDKWSALTPEQRKKFPPLCPDFVVELMSESDTLKETDRKMREYMDNGCRLGWLINPPTEEARVYRADGSVSVIHGFDNALSGEDVLPDFSFELRLLR